MRVKLFRPVQVDDLRMEAELETFRHRDGDLPPDLLGQPDGLRGVKTHGRVHPAKTNGAEPYALRRFALSSTAARR